MTAPATPKPAATVLLVRDTADGLEVHLIRRVKGMPFAGGMTAYPGGGVDRRDGEADLAWSGPSPAEWATAFRCDEPTARALVCAAVRETFEEAGILLASEPGGAPFPVDTPEWDAERAALVDRTASLAALLQRRGLVLRADLLRPWAHWVTPEAEPRRYDTRFFLAAAPDGVPPRNVGGEADHAEWVRPAVALAEGESGARPMLTPTVETLRQLVACTTVAEALDAAPQGLSPVMPRLEVDADGHEWVVLPDGSRSRPPIRLGTHRSVAE